MPSKALARILDGIEEDLERYDKNVLEELTASEFVVESALIFQSGINRIQITVKRLRAKKLSCVLRF